jgi:hypothetical protein
MVAQEDAYKMRGHRKHRFQEQTDPLILAIRMNDEKFVKILLDACPGDVHISVPVCVCVFVCVCVYVCVLRTYWNEDAHISVPVCVCVFVCV